MARFYLKDGTNFEANPDGNLYQVHRQEKLDLVMSLNFSELATNKVWTAEAVRALAQGLVPVTTDGKRSTRGELLDRLEGLRNSMVQELALKASVAVQDTARELWEDYSFKLPDHEILKGMSVDELVELVCVKMRERKYTPATTKKVLTDVRRVLADVVSPQDVATLKRELGNRFRHIYTEVKRLDGEALTKKKENWTVLYELPVTEFIADTLQRVYIEDPRLSWKEVSWAVLLATGRRPVEIHGIGTFEPAKGMAHYEFEGAADVVHFKGQAKTKGNNDSINGYDIPVLLPLNDILKMLWYLDLQGRRGLTAEEVVKKVDKKMTGAELPLSIRRLKRESGIEKFYGVRAWYACYCSAHYREEDQHQDVFLSRILGHKEHDSLTSTRYSPFRLQYEPTEDQDITGEVAREPVEAL